jgi:hypothetical protein
MDRFVDIVKLLEEFWFTIVQATFTRYRLVIGGPLRALSAIINMQINELREFGDRRIRDLDIREHTVGGADYQNRRRWNCSAMRKIDASAWRQN